MISSSSPPSRALSWVLFSCWLASAGCYNHAVQPSAPQAPRPPLPESQTGRYLITRGGEPVGEDRFVVVATSTVWRVEGQAVFTRPVEQTHRYFVEYDAKTTEPSRFRVEIELLGEKQTATGERDGDYLSGVVHAITGTAAFQIAYAGGTVVDFASPLFNVVPFALLGPGLQKDKPTPVRTITVPIPFLTPAVLLQDYLFVGRDGELRKVAVGPPARRNAAFWVRSDGFPVKVKTWAEQGGKAFVYELVAEPE